MTALPQPGRLLAIADYAALPEDEQHRWELVEGNLIMSPSPAPRHMIALKRLVQQVEQSLPAHLEIVPDVDLDLQLADERHPGTVRRPDLVVITRDELRRVDQEGGFLRASSATLVVEIISPGSRRTDMIFKRGDYADAGIPHYWIVDLEGPVSLVVCHLAGALGYQDSGEVTGVYDVVEPFPARVDLGALI